MKSNTRTYEINIKILHAISELTIEEKIAVEKAKEATYKSYAPYSNFNVGASAVMEDDSIIIGSNQENCAYPSGICAERTTVFYANSQHPDKSIKILAIAARNINGEFTERPISPCGACRQVLLESEKRQKTPMEIILYGSEEIMIIESASQLLPIQFDQSFLLD
jgi:cytidine deaminase